MANISKIKLPNGTSYDLKDSYKSGVYTVIGTQTAVTGSWTGNLHGVSALYSGLTINYYLPYAGSGNATLNLTLDDGTTTGAVNCYIHTSRLTTHYGAGRSILMTYYKAGDIKISGTATTDNRWVCDAYYDTNNRDKGFGKIKAGTASTATTAITANTSTAESSTYDELLTINPGNKWIQVAASNSSTAGSDTFTIGHATSVTAGTAGTSSATSGATLAVPYITYDAAGHITAAGTHTHTINSLAASTIGSGTFAFARLPSVYWANIAATSAAAYDKQPVVKDLTIGNGSGATAPTKKVQLEYDATLEVLNFVFT